MKTYTAYELSTILDKHLKWWNDEENGARANLSGANLSGANLSDADLNGAYQTDQDLRDAQAEQQGGSLQ